MKRLTMVVAAAWLCSACSKSPDPPKVPDAPSPKVKVSAVSGVQAVEPAPAPGTPEGAHRPADRPATNAKRTMLRNPAGYAPL